MVQSTSVQDMSIKEWWESMYPYAVVLEKAITTAPSELDKHAIDATIQMLPDILHSIQQHPCPKQARPMREYLLRATTYLIHAYQEMGNQNEHEVDFYYSSALTHVAKLHHQLVIHGFAS